MMERRIIRSRWLKRFLLMTLVAPLGLLWGEMFTRALLPQNVDSRMDIFGADPDVGFTYKPYAETYEKGREYNARYQINSLGLRDREYGAKKKGIFRVLLLGDSFSVSHGLPIEDSLSRQMERALQGVAEEDGMPVKFEVINAAVGGYSPYNYWKAYRRWAPVFEPDAVLVGLSPDDYDCSNENAEIGQRQDRAGKLSIKRLRKWLSWNSEFYILMRNFLYYNDLVSRVILWKSPGGVENKSQLQLYMVRQQEKVAKVWSKTFFYLQNLEKEVATDGVVMMVIPIPMKMEIDSQQYRQVLAANGLKDGQIDLDQQLREISAFCRKANIVVLDPRRAMRERHAEAPCYFVFDGHWNAEGVRVACGSLVRQWRDLGLPPWTSLSAKSVDH